MSTNSLTGRAGAPSCPPASRRRPRVTRQPHVGGGWFGSGVSASDAKCLQQAVRVSRLPPQGVAAVHAIASPQAAAFASYEFYDEDSDFGWRNSFEQAYTTGRVLGQGSFGTVQLAVNLHTGKQVAVKVLPKQRGKLSRERTLERLAREVDIIERLQGSGGGVIALEDVFEDTDYVKIVTELCSGGDLQTFSETHGALSERALAYVALEVLKVVRACHTAGLLHGDVKPANFCLKHASLTPLTDPNGDYSDFLTTAATSTSWLKAIDFGCSQMLPANGRRLSKRTGTPVYMAPEIYQREYHTEADMWSVGVMLYQLFARRFPFWDDMEACKASKLEEVAEAVANAEIRTDYGPWLGMSPAGRSFIAGCLNRNPEQRLTVAGALQHPWLAQQLFDPAARRDSAAAAAHSGMNHILKVTAATGNSTPVVRASAAVAAAAASTAAAPAAAA